MVLHVSRSTSAFLCIKRHFSIQKREFSRSLMNTHGNLLFGLVAFQSGAVESDQLAETSGSCQEHASS
jgi:hypothetical protein